MKSTEYCGLDGPLGEMLLAVREERLIGVWYDAQKHFPCIDAEDGWHTADTPLLRETARQLNAYFDNERMTFDLPLAPRGTEFQESVWRILQGIPVGETCTYGDVARRLGDPKAVRAVGAAVGRNPISIIIPCHRVVGANGSLTGYAGGVDRKAWLLDLESGQQPMQFSRSGKG